MDKRIGAQYYTIRDFCGSLDDFDESCKKIAKIGYKTVQLSGIGEFDPKEIKKVLDKYNLEAVCTHRPAKNYIESIESEIEYHKAINCHIAGLGMFPYDKATPETVQKFIDEYSPAAERLKESGIVFAYHNHCLEFAKSGGEYLFDMLLNGFKSDNLKLILDVYWLAYSGIDPAKFIRKYKDKIACVHFKDLRIEWFEHKFAEVGLGNLNWEEIIDACGESDAEYALVEQDICVGDPFDSLKQSYDFLSGKGFC